jgi:DNA-binding NarL/FixJ family response regulator
MEGYLSRYHRVYLVDDHDIVRRGVRDLLVPARDIEVVGDSGSARSAVRAILDLEPDVMLLDLHLQDGTGIAICREVRSIKPSIAGLLLTAAGDDEARAAAVLAGAAGYLVKVSRSSNLMNAIREVQPGRTLMEGGDVDAGSELLRSVIDALTPPVTAGERRILDLVIEGRTDSQVADALADHVSSTTVTAVVARVTDALLGQGSPFVEPGNGRHRRPD